MPSDYDKICQDNIRRRGEEFDDIGRLISEQLYSDRTHFIYELLQNAEDALGRRQRNNPESKMLKNVKFILYKDRLEFRHFGEEFNVDDVKGISDVLKGTKAGDRNQIGKFGIGFKSVYAFTSTPEIHSGDEHFIIERYIRPRGAVRILPIFGEETVFIFPFNHKEISEKHAFKLIEEKLKKIGSRVLLFLGNISEIEWKIEGQDEGIYLKEEKQCGQHTTIINVIGQHGNEEEEEEWLIFSRYIVDPSPAVESWIKVAFRLIESGNTKKKLIHKIDSSPLVVYFPTKLETRLGFLIQGPYDTTASRSDIEDNKWNEKLIKETAFFLTNQILPTLKMMGLLTVSLLEALPIRMEEFPEDSQFSPLAKAVSETLKNQELLPAYKDGTFVSGRHAKLARRAELRELLSHGQLRELFQSKNDIRWLSGEITEARTPDLRSYLMSELSVEEVRPDRFAQLITDVFLEAQTDHWIIQFYNFLGKDLSDLWKRPDSILRRKKILRLEDNSHVTPSNPDGRPNAYLPSFSKTNFPIIKREIFQNDEAKEFLKNLGLFEPDLFAEIIEFILPKYAENTISIDLQENIEDLRKIKLLLQNPLQIDANNFIGQLRVLLTKLGLQDYEDQFTNTIDQNLNLILLKVQIFPSINFIRAVNADIKKYKSAKEIYLNSAELRMYFKNNPSAWFIDESYPSDLEQLFKELSIASAPRINCRRKTEIGHVIIRNSHGSHERGLNGFDPDISVDGIEHALTNPAMETSVFIWNQIAQPHINSIRGVIERSSKKTYENSKKVDRISSFGYLLIENAWLLSKDGRFYKPSDITLDDLPDSYNKDEKLAQQLGMRNPEREEALEVVTGGDLNLKILIRHYQSASEDERKKILKIIPHESPPAQAPSFKDGLRNLGRSQRGKIELGDRDKYPVSNPERYQEKLNEQVSEEVEDHLSTPRKITFSPVRDNPSNAEARHFLYEEYRGNCQVTGTTFPKASRNAIDLAENYFESCSLLAYSNADYLNNPGNMLCVSADTMAKLKHASVEFIENLENVIETFKANGESAENVSVKIRLADEECYIQWSQRHFMRLVALYENA